MRYLQDFRYTRDLQYTRYLRDLLLTKEVAANALTQLTRNSSAFGDLIERVDLLNILVGRLLHIDEANEMGDPIEQESVRIVGTALGYLTANGTSDEEEINDVILDIVRSLPLRSTNEITYTLDLAEKSTDGRVQNACVYALGYAKPKTNAAWVALEAGKGSRIEGVRKAVESVLERRKE